MKKTLLFLAFTFCIFISFSQTNKEKLLEEVIRLRDIANNSDLDINTRFETARKSIELAKKTKYDSTILESNRALSYLFIINGDFDSLYGINKINLKLASKLKDTLKQAYAYHNIAFYFDRSNKFDSAYFYYYKARTNYRLNKVNTYNEAGILLNMANIQETERDYIGSEINAINGIKIISQLPQTDQNLDSQWSLHNLVGVVSSQINRFDKAIEYHNKALSYAEKIKNKEYEYLKWYSKINISILYRRKREYAKSLEILESLIKTYDLEREDPSSYVSAISNIAYNKFLNGSTNFLEIENDFKKSLEIAKMEEDDVEVLSVNLFLAEFYLKQNKKQIAKSYVDDGLKLAKILNANNDFLKALVLKSKIEEGDQSKKYLYEHIKLNDSLVLAERSIRNKFARIELETDEIIQENEQISRQRLWLIITSIGLLGILFFLYIIKSQREKNKELQLERQQQEANEEIYNLMLSQQDKIDEARSFEKNRISKDIHDGILGKLFGVRLSLDGLNLSTTPEATQKRSNYINELKNIEEEIRKVSHELNSDFIEKSGYLDIIKTLVDTQMNAYSINYTLTTEDGINWDALNNKIKIHVYRILQETMQNAYKHAKATIVDISFKLDKNQLTLSVSDNGEGFDLQKAKKGIGLKNIDSRIKEIDGELIIETQKDKGTKIIINVPALNN
ncbi:ATP-binding protein [Olleya sp. R77988]|uniref:ATP-binding protein n=1 Tax=Olleya sp. R77988 TaxID=3093875 RepID=UPI0037CAAAE7